MVADWNHRSVLKSWVISLTNLWKGSLRMSSTVLFWKCHMSLSITVPALYLWVLICHPCSLPQCTFSICASIHSSVGKPKLSPLLRARYVDGRQFSVDGRVDNPILQGWSLVLGASLPRLFLGYWSPGWLGLGTGLPSFAWLITIIIIIISAAFVTS